MKTLKYLFTLAALTGALTLSAKANVITDLGEFATPNQNPDSITTVATPTEAIPGFFRRYGYS